MKLRTTDQSDDASACSEFLALYGDFADGMLDIRTAARLRQHSEVCGSCARYDRIIRRGADLARDILSVEPSPDFEQRLQHRIFHEQDTAALHGTRPAAVATAIGVAAMIALLAWSPLLLQDAAPEASSAQRAEWTVTPVNAGVAPFTGGATWYPVSATSSSASLAAFPGPHSPLIVTPPAHRSVRND